MTDSDSSSSTDGSGAEHERFEREEFARGHAKPGSPASVPRDAATIVTAREAGNGYEVLLLERPESSRFAAGAFVFAGGVVDEADGSVLVQSALPSSWAACEGPALAAGLRELFEETGFLLSDEPLPRQLEEQARRALLQREANFGELIERFRLRFHSLRAVYLARWVTPERLSRRYDARFFLTRAPDREPVLTGELTSHMWIRPAEAVRRFRAGTLRMLFPTRVTLERLAELATLDDVFREYGDNRRTEVMPILPRLLISGEDIIPVLPGDSRYNEAAP